VSRMRFPSRQLCLLLLHVNWGHGTGYCIVVWGSGSRSR
jgi:hypothetical protein